MSRKKLMVKQEGPWMEIVHRFSRNRMAMFGFAVIFLLVLCAVFAPLIAPYGYDDQNIPIASQSPNAEHWFGTDNFGRDIFSRVIYGSRISLQVGLIAVTVAIISGGIMGAVSAYYGGVIDHIIMRFMDILMAIPGMLLAIAIAASLGPGLRNMMIAIGVGNVPGYAR
ncbi:MAG: ABC transporter permease, partial [Treponema sp.]|nr:ABC transporter permease [Treponema sp.]